MISNSKLSLSKAIEIEESHQSSKMKQKRILRRVLKTTLKILVISMQISTAAYGKAPIAENEIQKVTPKVTKKSKALLRVVHKGMTSKYVIGFNSIIMSLAIIYGQAGGLPALTFIVGLMGHFFNLYH